MRGWIPLLAAMMLAGGCAQRSSPEQQLKGRFPVQARRIMEAPGFAAAGEQFVRSDRPAGEAGRADRVRAAQSAVASRAQGLELSLPQHAGEAAVLDVPGLRVEVRERGVTGKGETAGNAVAYARSSGAAYWSSGHDHLEEWILAEEAGEGPVAEWEIAGATLRQVGERVELLDGSGVARVKVTAPIAWRADGREAKAWLRAEGGVLGLFTDGRGSVLVDPVWQVIPAEFGHAFFAGTLQPDGRVVFLANTNGWGSNSDRYDPNTGAWAGLGAPPQTNGQRYSAVLLADGRALASGGSFFFCQASVAEQATTAVTLFDPVSETWSVGSPLIEPRWDGSSTRLPSGKVLVAGGCRGQCNAETPLSGAELYDPASGTWSRTGSMNSPRCRHTATILPSGKVLVTGGQGAGTSAEIYDPATGTWALTGVLPYGRAGHGATLLATGNVLVTGSPGALDLSTLLYDYTSGLFSQTGSLLAPPAWIPGLYSLVTLPNGKALLAGVDAQTYDPSLGTWSLAATLPTGHGGAISSATVLASGRVLLAGGTPQTWAAVADLYDPSAPSLSSSGTLKTPRVGHTSTTLRSGLVLLAGGTDAGGAALATTEMYDPATGAFAPGPALKSARTGHTATTLASGKVLMVGGEAVGAPLASVEILDPSGTATVAPGSAMAEARAGHSATLLATGGVLVVGGKGSAGSLASAELFDPVAGAWSAAGSLAVGRSQHSAVLLSDGRAVVVGGMSGTSPLASAEIFDPSSSTFAALPSMGAARSSSHASLLANGKVLVAGGEGGAGPLASAELLTVIGVAGSWSPTGSLATARSGQTGSALHGGGVLLAGGAGPSGILNDAEIYDTVSGTWSVVPGLAARTGHAASSLQSGQVLLSGGRAAGVVGSSVLFDEGRGAVAGRIPLLNPFTLPVVAGSIASIAGARFSTTMEAGSSIYSSATNHPIITLERADGGPAIPLQWASPGFTATSAAVKVPRTVLPGPYRARVTVSGIPSASVFVTVAPGATISPAAASVVPRESKTFTASGGTGSGYRWSLASAPSGGNIGASTGLYTAGNTGGVTDVVRLVDSANNADQLSVTVTAGPLILPAVASAPPRGSLLFTATGGGGTGYTWGYPTNLSGGSLDPVTGAYTAGANGGVTDVVSVTDGFGNTTTRDVTVRSGITITPSPASSPPKGPIAFTAIGGQGSGYLWEITTDRSGARIGPSTGAYVAGGVGGVLDVVKVTDPLGNSASCTVTVTNVVSISPPTVSLAPNGTQTFSAFGGKGSGYVFSLKTNGSGGSIDPASGAYVAGLTGPATDVIQVADPYSNVATATVTVGPGVTVSPATKALVTRQSLTLNVVGGAGTPYAWSMRSSPSGGTVSPAGLYTAGPNAGLDVVQAADRLNNTGTATIQVVPPLAVAPTAPTVLVGETVDFTASGGSGAGFAWVVRTNRSGATIDPATGAYVAGATAGTDVVEVTDSLGFLATATVTVQPALVIQPATTSVQVGEERRFTGAGGSAAGYVFDLPSSGSGGAIDRNGLYRAGSSPGTDVVRLSDSLSRRVTSTVTVVPLLVVTPARATVDPKGVVAFSVAGGSGSGYRWSLASNRSSGAVGPADGRYQAGRKAGTADRVQVTDALGNVATADVEIGGDALSCGNAGGAPSLLALLGLLLLVRRKGSGGGATRPTGPDARAGRAGPAAMLVLLLALPQAALGADPSPRVKDLGRPGAPTARTAVLDLTTGNGVDAKLARVATDALVSSLQTEAGIPIISERDVQTGLGFEQRRAVAGKLNEARIAEIGSALGVEVIVFGTVSRVGNTFVFSAQALDTRQGHVLRRYQSRSAAATEEALLELADRGGDDIAPFLPGSRAMVPIGALLPRGEVPVPEPVPVNAAVAEREPWSFGFAPGGPALAPATEPRVVLTADEEGRYGQGFSLAVRGAATLNGGASLSGVELSWRQYRWLSFSVGAALGGTEWPGAMAGITGYLPWTWKNVHPYLGARGVALFQAQRLFGVAATAGAELRLGRVGLAVELPYLNLISAPSSMRQRWFMAGAALSVRL
jgi:hypothetical protein